MGSKEVEYGQWKKEIGKETYKKKNEEIKKI